MGGAPTTGIQMGDDAAVKASVQNYYGEVSCRELQPLTWGLLKTVTKMVAPRACIWTACKW